MYGVGSTYSADAIVHRGVYAMYMHNIVYIYMRTYTMTDTV